MRDIVIQGKKIGVKHPPFIVAEMSGNHNQSLEQALAIVDAAAKAGVHALKLQTYTADTMTIDCNKREFFIKDKKSLWNGISLYKLYQKAYTPWQWHKPIFDRCKKLGIIGFSTPFDKSAVDFLESLDVPCYKIASFENIDLPLIKKVALTGKPIIVSTGMAKLEEIEEAVRCIRKTGNRKIILFKCTSSYPAKPEDSNIRTLLDMQQHFDCLVGLSDHTLGIGAAIVSIPYGACMIEKHFTLSRDDGGVDSAFSLEPSEMSLLTKESKQAWCALGKVYYGPTEKEKKSIIFRRSLYAVEDIKNGEAITEKNIRAIRPGLGLPPKHYDSLIGKKANRNIKKGTPFNWRMIANL